MKPAKFFIPILSIAFCLGVKGQSVSNITFDGIGDSSVRVIFTVSSAYDTLRVRYGTSSCASGSGGSIQTTTTNYSYALQIGMASQLSGLAPSTTYHACPEVKNGGGSYSTGADATFTTLARTVTTPTAPTAVSTTFPAQAGTTHNVPSLDCDNVSSGLQYWLTNAVPGDTIVVPAGTVCSGTYTTPRAPDSVSFTVSATSTSTVAMVTSGFTENQEVHFSTGAGSSDCLPGQGIFQANGINNLYAYNCSKGGGWNQNSKYYIHIFNGSSAQILDAPSGNPVIPGWVTLSAVDTTGETISYSPTVDTPGGYTYHNNVVGVPVNAQVQFVSSGTLPSPLVVNTTYFLLDACAKTTSAVCTTQVAATSGGAAINLTTAGSGTITIVDAGQGTMYIAKAPAQSDPWILITTSGILPAAGTRITSASDAELFHFTKADYTTIPIFSTGILAHNWRISGALFDTGTNSDYLTTTDPRAFCGGPTTYQDSRFIAFDQIRIQGAGYPNRFGCGSNGTTMFWDGGYVSFINSDMRGLDFWHPYFGSAAGATGVGIVPTLASGTQVTATAGVGHGGVFTTTLTGTTTINFTGGSATGTCYVYFAMDGTLKILCPTTTTGTCSATGSIVPSATLTCTVSATASPAFPLDANGRRAALGLFKITLTSGVVTAVISYNVDFDASIIPTYSSTNFEGCSCIVAGNGPGPYSFSNNYASSAGLTVHFDDSGGTILQRSDYTINGNTFDILDKYNPGNGSWDGFWYGNRQPLEWKAGQRISVCYNIFSGSFTQVNSVGTAIIISPRSGGYSTDIDICSNQFLNVNGFFGIFAIETYAPVSKPIQRARFKNNRIQTDGWTHTNPPSVANGFGIYGGWALEDFTIDHNTNYDNRGVASAFFHWVNTPIGGVSITNNIHFYTGDGSGSVMFFNESVAGCTVGFADKAFMDCAFTSGPGVPSYTFTNNVVLPSWADSQAPSGVVARATINSGFGTLFSGGSNFLPPLQSTQPNYVSYVNFAGNKSLALASPYTGLGTGGSTPGFFPAAPVITTTCPLPDGSAGAPYSQAITATGDATIVFTVTTGALPVGLSLSSGGLISGTPTSIGTSFTITASNGVSPDATLPCSIAIVANGGFVSGGKFISGGKFQH